jgi:hypothetical protein
MVKYSLFRRRARLCILLIAGLWAFFPGQAQLAARLKQHIVYLASDSLHGRMTGSPDEIKAADYIISQFKSAHVASRSGNFKTKAYLQHFIYNPIVDSVKTHVEGNNVIAYINNHAANTIVIGAHYDHLGWGDEKHSLYRGKPAIHHGADDNASGVAAVIEVARALKQSKYKHNNYLFITFSGEELGLYGSKWFVQHPLVKLDHVNYMINYDMVGRMDSIKHTLILNGIGTSPVWREAIRRVQTTVHLKTTESGVGPSDHTSFYLKNIPVLFFFTGQHKDYHKPSDEEYKINYKGLVDVVNYSLGLIAELDTINKTNMEGEKNGKLVFTKTKDENNDDVPKFKVTLGVMPDYTFEGEGMRIDAVSDGRPASKAGLLSGDIVIQLGAIKVTELTSYMKALGQFNKGDKTTVKVKRGNQVIEKEVQF